MFMSVIALVIFISLVLYAVLIIRYTASWNKSPEYVPGRGTAFIHFSVIVPFRNEELRLRDILHDLSVQDYPAGNTEIILVNDHSGDGSAAIAQEYSNRFGHFSLIHLPDGESGKKAALEAGVRAAANEYIVTTDADCRAGRQWLSSMASFCRDFSPALVIGPVVTVNRDESFLDYFQQLESLSLTGAGSASALGGKPIFCSGANLCYRREAFTGLRDPMLKAVASGDDTFLLLQMKRLYRYNIRVLKSKQALITTPTEGSLKDFLRQRWRWISKSVHYRDREIVYAAWVVMLANLAMPVSALCFAVGCFPWLFPVVWGVKLGADGWFISTLSAFYGVKFRPGYYLLAGILYPFYLMVAVAGGMLLPVEWKGRRGV